MQGDRVLVPEWRKAFRMASIQVMVLLAVVNVVPAVWDEFRYAVPTWAWATGNVVLSVLGMVARLVYQPVLHQGASDE